MSDADEREKSFFADNRNIVIGKGRIIWAPGDGLGQAPGFVLPGGRRTQDQTEAREVAAAIDEMSR